MLSYRHSFHAGNHADVLKHLVLFLVADYLTRKDKPLVYVDTHAGAGMYQLDQAHARKNHEYLSGIQKLYDAESQPVLINNFVNLIYSITHNNKTLYPGSPAIAQALLKEHHRLMLHELHPTDLHRLMQLMSVDKRVRVIGNDGYQGLISIVPPKERRALVLIDPPYEIKQDYQLIVTTLEKACKRFATGVYLLWYPIVQRSRIERLHHQIEQLNLPFTIAELQVAPDNDDHGMTGSGMVILNPPYPLAEQLQELLPWLSVTLAGQQGKFSLRTNR